jgi:hypothetical protein
MSKVGSWSTTAGNNNATPPDGWPEGQAPSTVNDCAREMMAQIKTLVNDLQYIDLAHVPTRTGDTTFTLPGNLVSTYEIGRRIKAFDVSIYYATVISASFTANTGLTVRLDSGALTASFTSVAVAVLSETNNSLPNAVWRRKNFIINGSMDIWQRSAVFQPVNNAVTYTADRWLIELSTGGALAISRSERSANTSNVPSLAQSGVFFTNSLLVSCSAVDAAVAAGEFAYIGYKVEGFDWRQIAHKPMNLSFWVNTRQSGIYAVSFTNSGLNNTFVQNYTVSAIATWTKFSIAIPEAPTTGTWDYSSGIGLHVRFALEAGATYQGGAGNWTATNILATASQVNFLGSAGNTFAITGVQLEEGTFATPLEIRSYAQELELAKRYYQEYPDLNATNTGTLFGFSPATNVGQYNLNYPEMRGSPTITFPTISTITAATGAGTPVSVSAITASPIGPGNAFISANIVGTPFTIGQGSYLAISAGSVIQLDAEL